MGRKYHINSKGSPAVCRAKDGNCPFGGSDSHYDSFSEAQQGADKKNELEHGLFKELNKVTREAESEKDFEEINQRLEAFKEEEIKSGIMSYFTRCKTNEKLNNYVPNDKKTVHYNKERMAKDKIITDKFGDGELISHYKINHSVSGKYAEQVIGIYDTGQIKVYDVDTGEIVTTFVPSKGRMEIMLLKAGEIPDKEWLEKVKENKKTSDKAWEEVEHLYDKRKKRSSKVFSKTSTTDLKEKEDNRRNHRSRKPNTNKDVNNKPKQHNPKPSNPKQATKPKVTKKQEPQFNKHGILING